MKEFALENPGFTVFSITVSAIAVVTVSLGLIDAARGCFFRFCDMLQGIGSPVRVVEQECEEEEEDEDED